MSIYTASNYDLKELATLTIAETPMVKEGSFGEISVGSHNSTMTLYRETTRRGVETTTQVFIEWDIPGLDITENIGLELEGEKHVVGYDGVMSFPRPAKPWLESLGYTFAEDVI